MIPSAPQTIRNDFEQELKKVADENKPSTQTKASDKGHIACVHFEKKPVEVFHVLCVLDLIFPAAFRCGQIDTKLLLEFLVLPPAIIDVIICHFVFLRSGKMTRRS